MRKKSVIMLWFLTILFLVGCSNNNAIVKKVYTVSGKESEMVIYYQLSGNFEVFYFAKEDHSQRIDPRVIANSHSLTITNAKGTSDYYIDGLVLSNTANLQIEDSIGTALHIETISISESEEKKSVFYIYGYLDGYQEGYTITVNGEKYDFIINPSPYSS